MSKLLFSALLITSTTVEAVITLQPYPSNSTGDPAEGAMRWGLNECDYGYTLTHISRCHWTDHTNGIGEVYWTYGYETPTGHYTVPNSVSGYVGTNYYTYVIKGLGNGGAVFQDLESVTISEGIEEICGAFYGVTNLMHVSFPSSLKRIVSGNYCSFGCCTSLQYVTFPPHLEVIGNGSFSGSGLTSVVLPNSVTNVGARAFSECSDLSSVTLSDGNIWVGYDAFKDCTALQMVWYGGCCDIPSRCFYGCALLSSFLGSCAITNIEDSAFYGCSSLTNFPYADGLVEIGASAFEGCSSFTAIDLPDGMLKLGSYAYQGCSNVERVRIPSSMSSFSSTSFSQVMPGDLLTGQYTFLMTRSSVTNLTILPGMTSYAPVNTYRGGQYARVELPETVSSIGRLAFQNNTNLVDFVTHGKIESIGEKAFAGCTSIASLPSCCNCSVTNWGESVFQYCSSLTSVRVPRSMKTIPASMFANCTELKEVIIEEGVETIPYTAFVGDTSLRMVSIPSTASNLTSTTSTSSSYLPYKQADIICYRTDPPANFYKAFLRNFAGNLYYPPAGKDAWEAMLDQNGLSACGKSWAEADENASATVSINNTPVPLGWLAKYKLTESERPDVAAAKSTGKLDGSNNELCVWHDFIAGTDPTNATSLLSATIEMVNGIPHVQWTPDLNENGTKAIRTYKVWGKVTLDDTSDWESPTNSLHHFFKVTVEMP